MQLIVHLHTLLQIPSENGLVNRLTLSGQPGMTLGELVSRLGVQVDPEQTLLVVNGQIAEMTTELSDGDEVHLIPAISGG